MSWLRGLIRNRGPLATGEFRPAIVVYFAMKCSLCTMVNFGVVCDGDVRMDVGRPRFKLP